MEKIILNFITFKTKCYKQVTKNCHCVVYFDQLLGAARTLKAGQNTFFSCFQPFFLLFKRFSMNFGLKSRKMFKNTVFSAIPKAGWHANAGRLPEGVPQICLFWLIFSSFKHFSSFFGWFQSCFMPRYFWGMKTVWWKWQLFHSI